VLDPRTRIAHGLEHAAITVMRGRLPVFGGFTHGQHVAITDGCKEARAWGRATACMV
jgi:hypothetical protein